MQNNGSNVESNSLDYAGFIGGIVPELTGGPTADDTSYYRRIMAAEFPQNINLNGDLLRSMVGWFYSQATKQPLDNACSELDIIYFSALKPRPPKTQTKNTPPAPTSSSSSSTPPSLPSLPGSTPDQQRNEQKIAAYFSSNPGNKGMVVLEKIGWHWIAHGIFANAGCYISKNSTSAEYPSAGSNAINKNTTNKVITPNLIQQKGENYCGFISFFNCLSYGLLARHARQALSHGIKVDQTFYTQELHKYDIAPYKMRKEDPEIYANRMGRYIGSCVQPLMTLAEEQKDRIITLPRYVTYIHKILMGIGQQYKEVALDLGLPENDVQYAGLHQSYLSLLQNIRNNAPNTKAQLLEIWQNCECAKRIGLDENSADIFIANVKKTAEAIEQNRGRLQEEELSGHIKDMPLIPDPEFWSKQVQDNDAHYVASTKADLMTRLEALYRQIPTAGTQNQKLLLQEIVRLHRAVEYTTRSASSFQQAAIDLRSAAILVAQYEQLDRNNPDLASLQNNIARFYNTLWSDNEVTTQGRYQARNADAAILFDDDVYQDWRKALSGSGQMFDPFSLEIRLAAAAQRQGSRLDNQAAKSVAITFQADENAAPYDSIVLSDEAIARAMQGEENKKARGGTVSFTPIFNRPTAASAPLPSSSTKATTTSTSLPAIPSASLAPPPTYTTTPPEPLPASSHTPVAPPSNPPKAGPAPIFTEEPASPAAPMPTERTGLRRRKVVGGVPNPASEEARVERGPPTASPPPAQPAPQEPRQEPKALIQQPYKPYVPHTPAPIQTGKGELSVPKTAGCVAGTALASFFLDVSIVMPFMTTMDRMQFKDILDTFALSWQRTFNPLAPGPELIGIPAAGAFLPIIFMIATAIGITYLAGTKGWLDISVDPNVVTSLKSAGRGEDAKTK